MQLKLAHPYHTITEFITLYNSNYELQETIIIIVIMISHQASNLGSLRARPVGLDF